MNKIEFFIPGPLPGMNEMIDMARDHWSESHRNRQMWVDHIAAIIGRVPKLERVHVHFHWLEKDRRRDPDNIIAAKKYVLDGMVAAGLVSNDGWVQAAGFLDTWDVNKKNPGVYVRVREVK